MQRGTEEWYAKSHTHDRPTDQVTNIVKIPIRLPLGHTIGGSPSCHVPVSNFPAEVLGMDYREDEKGIDNGGRRKCGHRRLTWDKGCVIRIKYG